MYTKLGYYKDKKNFGNQIVLYGNDDNFLVIINDRGELSYFFVDSNIEKMYPVNSYMKKNGFDYDFLELKKQIKIALKLI